jgi:hypothetical protein
LPASFLQLNKNSRQDTMPLDISNNDNVIEAHNNANNHSNDTALFLGFDYTELWVGNAKQAASYYSIRLGFEVFAYRGPETGHKQSASYA